MPVVSHRRTVSPSQMVVIGVHATQPRPGSHAMPHFCASVKKPPLQACQVVLWQRCMPAVQGSPIIVIVGVCQAVVVGCTDITEFIETLLIVPLVVRQMFEAVSRFAGIKCWLREASAGGTDLPIELCSAEKANPGFVHFESRILHLFLVDGVLQFIR